MKPRKFLAIFLAAALICTAVPMNALTSSAETSGYYTYTVSNGEATITACDSDISGAVTVPDTLGGYPVTCIGSNAFYRCTGLASITIPDSVTRISDHAFYRCTGLTSITIPAGVTRISDHVFWHCTRLTSITIPAGVTSIGSYAFLECTSLTSITIPSSVTSIADYAFWSCTGLASITLPAGVTSIGDHAFGTCTSLTSIAVDSGNTVYMSINGVLFNKKKNELIRYPAGKRDTSYAIPDSVTSIGSYAFYKCTDLTSITIPDSVTSILDDAFSGCTGLTRITIPDSVPTICSYAFSGCTGLTSITIPDSVTIIRSYAFSGCKSLISITIPDGVKSICNYAFSNCKSLTSITIPDSVTGIDSNAFYECNNLTIYCNSGSGAKTYAMNHGINFVVENEVGKLYNKETAEKLLQPDEILKDIAFNYPMYLKNDSVNTYISQIYNISAEAFDDYSDAEIVRLCILEGYFKGTDIITNEIISLFGGLSTSEKWVKEATQKFLSEFETQEQVIFDSWDTVNQAYKDIDFAYGAADDISKLLLASSIAKSSKHLTADTITGIVDTAYENAPMLGINKAFDATGKLFDIVDLTIAICQIYDFQIENIDRLIGLTPESSALHQGLLMIKKDREKNAFLYVADNFLQKEVASALGKLVANVGKYATSKLYGSNGTITLAVVSTINELFYDYIYKVPKITDVHTAIVFDEFYSTVSAALLDKNVSILKAYNYRTDLSQEVLDDYKFLWDARISALKVFAEACSEIAENKDLGSIIEAKLDSIKPTLRFERYIGLCEKTLRNDIANGTVACGHYRSYPTRKVRSTCSSEGYTLNYCLTCCNEYVSEVDAVDGHDYVQTVIAPTCTSQGYTVYTCNNCRYSYAADYTDATGHTYTETDVESTCLVRGYTKHTCTTCGNSYNDNYKEVSGHSYEGWITVKESTCSAAGRVSKTCSICSDTEYARITEKPHTPESEWSVDTAPTEASNGIISHHCEVCGGAVDETELPFLRYENINLSLDNGCVISYKVDKALFTENGYAAPYASFTVDGNAESVNTYTEDDNFYTFEYELPYDCRSSDIAVRLYADFADVTYQSAELLTNAKVIGSAYCDINGDSEINVMDLIRLKKYIAGFDDTVTDDNADPDNSGNLDSADLSYLKKFILFF